MNRRIGLVASIFVALFLLGTNCMAQGIPGDQTPMVPGSLSPVVPGGQSPIGPGYQPPIPGGQSPIVPSNDNEGIVSPEDNGGLVRLHTTTFNIGDRVRITSTNKLNVRTAPGLNTQSIGAMAQGSMGTIIDGPKLTDNLIWYKVKYDAGTTGWSSGKWLEIIPGEQSPVSVCQAGYHFDSNAGTCVPDSETPQVEHPATGPESMQPNEAPPASTGKVVTTLGDKQALNSQEIMANFGSGPQSSSGTSPEKGMMSQQVMHKQIIIPTGIQYWAFYNGMWTQGPSAVFFNQYINSIIINDQAQNIWTYERYPNNWPVWSYWGYRWAGNYHALFKGDMQGWHLCAIYGDKSGWSNVLWVYVW